MSEKILRKVVDEVGFEQILLDAEMTIDSVMILLHDLGYIDLEQYETEEMFE